MWVLMGLPSTYRPELEEPQTLNLDQPNHIPRRPRLLAFHSATRPTAQDPGTLS